MSMLSLNHLGTTRKDRFLLKKYIMLKLDVHKGEGPKIVVLLKRVSHSASFPTKSCGGSKSKCVKTCKNMAANFVDIHWSWFIKQLPLLGIKHGGICLEYTFKKCENGWSQVGIPKHHHRYCLTGRWRYHFFRAPPEGPSRSCLHPHDARLVLCADHRHAGGSVMSMVNISDQQSIQFSKRPKHLQSRFPTCTRCTSYFATDGGESIIFIRVFGEDVGS